MHWHKIVLLISIFVTITYSATTAQCPSTRAVLNDRSIPKLKNLITALHECDQYPDSLALAYHTLGTSYNFVNWDSAIYFTNQALDIRKELFKDQPAIDLGKSYHNLGYFYAKKRLNKKAIEPLKKAIEIYADLNVGRMLNSYLELANAYAEEGEYKIAEDYYKLVILEGKKIEDYDKVGKALLNISDVLNDRKEYQEAIAYLQEAIPVFKELDYFEEEAYAYNNLGNSNYFLKNYQEAIDYYEVAIKMFEELEYYDEVAKNYSNLSRALQQNGQKNKAFSIIQKGIEEARKSGDQSILAANYDNLGAYHMGTGFYEHAIVAYQNAIRALIPDFDPQYFYQNPTEEQLKNVSNKIDLLIYFSDKARGLFLNYEKEKKDKHLSSAIELYQLGDLLIDQLRREHTDQGTKLFWRENALPFYENAIEVCYVQQDVNQAFHFFEKSRAILLLEALHSSDALSNIPDSIQTITFDLKSKLIEARENLETVAEENKAAHLRNLIDIQEKYDRHLVRLADIAPEYANARFQFTELEFSEFLSQELSSENQMAIHFFYGENEVYALASSKQKVVLHKLGMTVDIEKSIRDFLTYFEKSSAIENAPDQFLEKGKELYQLIFKPLDLTGIDELLLFPDGALAYVPFEAMVRSKEGNLTSADYLIRTLTIRYAYSANILRQQLGEEQTKPSSIAAFAPFANQASDQYPPLSFSNDELSKIKNQVEGVYLIDQEAIKYWFLKHKDKYPILHLSTHAFASTEASRPHIVFADTSLYLSELYATRIPAELVVLSACQTNIGKLSPGEGVMSLGRGFTYAGARSFISSLWNVNAASTSQVLSMFYDELNNNLPKYKALHKAKLNYLENEEVPAYERSPYYWAGFVYYGDQSEVKLKSSGKVLFWIWGGIIILLLAGLSFLFKIK